MEVAQKDMMQIAASLAEFERVEAVGMKSATLPDKIDALLRDLARLRRKDREESKERGALRLRLAEVEGHLRDAGYRSLGLSAELEKMEALYRSTKDERDDARRVAKRLADAVDVHGMHNGYRFFSESLSSALRDALAYEVEP